MVYNPLMFSPHQISQDFPILRKRIHATGTGTGKRLAYLDNAATSQKPQVVIDAITNYYQNHNANVHRGVHQLGDESTKLFHESRKIIAEFFGTTPDALVVTRNATEAINLVCQSWGEQNINEGDTIIVTEWEHHSNFVTWQRLAAKKHAELWAIPVSQHGDLDLDAFDQKLHASASVKLLAIGHVSNTLGAVAPIEKLVKMLRAKHKTAKVLVDGAQAAPHMAVHFDKLPVDFYAVSAHKMLGPMGIGGVFVRPELLNTLEPALVGGGMIDTVSLAETTYAESLEDRFTAGTPDVASLVGWAAACEYLKKLGMANVEKHGHELIAYALSELAKLPQIQVVGPLSAQHRTSVVTFLYTGVHAHDVAQILDSEGVAIRSGHHCTMPLHVKFGWAATIRMSFQVYSCKEDIDQTVVALKKVQKIFGV